MINFKIKKHHVSLPEFTDSYLPLIDFANRYHNTIRYARLGKKRIAKATTRPTIRGRMRYIHTIKG